MNGECLQFGLHYLEFCPCRYKLCLFTHKRKFWPLAFAIFLDSFEVLKGIKLWISSCGSVFPSKLYHVILDISPTWEAFWLCLWLGFPLHILLTSVSLPDFSLKLSTVWPDPSPLLFSVLDPCPQNFPSVIPWLAVTLCMAGTPLAPHLLRVYPAFMAVLKFRLFPVSLQASISGGEVGKTTLLFLIFLL